MHSLVPQIYGDGRPPLHKEKLHHVRELARDLGVATSAPRIPVDPPLLRHVYPPHTHTSRCSPLKSSLWTSLRQGVVLKSWIDVPHLQQ